MLCLSSVREPCGSTVMFTVLDRDLQEWCIWTLQPLRAHRCVFALRTRDTFTNRDFTGAVFFSFVLLSTTVEVLTSYLIYEMV